MLLRPPLWSANVPPPVEEHNMLHGNMNLSPPVSALSETVVPQIDAGTHHNLPEGTGPGTQTKAPSPTRTKRKRDF